MLAEFGLSQGQREKLIEEARARLQWAAASGETPGNTAPIRLMWHPTPAAI